MLEWDWFRRTYRVEFFGKCYIFVAILVLVIIPIKDENDKDCYEDMYQLILNKNKVL